MQRGAQTQTAPPETTHWPLKLTFLQVALRAPPIGAGLHAYPVVHDTDMTVPCVAGDGTE